MPRPIFLTYLSCLFWACSAPAPTAPALSAKTPLVPAVTIVGDTPVLLSDRMVRYKVPAVSIAVLETGHIVAVSAIVARQATDVPPVTSQTQFQAASIGKALTAVGVMRLVHHGHLDLDASANGYLSSFKLQHADGLAADNVTLRALLTHSAGVNVPSFPGFERNADLPNLRDILRGTDKAASAPIHVSQSLGPYRYSGGGFSVLEAVIEDVSGETFETVMQREVFVPLGMTQTSFNIAPDDIGRASGHDWQGVPIPGGWRDYPQSAAAGLWSTPTDLARLLSALHSAWSGEGESFLRLDLAREIGREQGGGMGLGFGVTGDGDTVLLSHSGANSGYNAYLLLYPETGNGAVVMANGDGGRYLYDDILRTVAQNRGWPDHLTAQSFDPNPNEADRLFALAGTYRMDPARFTIDINCDPASQECDVMTARGSNYRLRATSASDFHLIETGDRLTVASNGSISLWGMTGVPLVEQ